MQNKQTKKKLSWYHLHLKIFTAMFHQLIQYTVVYYLWTAEN